MRAKGYAIAVLVGLLVVAVTGLWRAGGPAAEGLNAQRDATVTERNPGEPVAARAAGSRPSFADKQDATLAVAADPPTVIASFDFDDGMGGPDSQGWQSRDATAQPGTFFHVDDFGGISPPYAPLSGTKSLWCGLRADSTWCSFATPPGYGNQWDQFFQSVAFPTTGSVSLSYDIRYDVEPGYDHVYVDYLSKTGSWNTLQSYNGTAATSDFVVVPAESLAGNVTFRFNVQSDGFGSDQDGFFPTDGAVVFDNIVVSDSVGVVDTQDFESEVVGALVTADGDWFAEDPAFGDYSGLFDGSTVLQEDPLVSNTTYLWGFFNASTDDYSCGGHPEQPAVPFTNNPGSTDERNYIHNDIYSPVIDLTQDIDGMPVPPSPSYLLSFDVYSDLPLDNLVVYDFHVRSLLNGCFTPWSAGGSYYGGGMQWVRPAFELENLIAFGATEIQVAIGVRDMCWTWCGLGYGTGACHSHAPLIDNVTVTVPTEPDTFVVTNANETGPGSLEWAVLLANSVALPSVVEFDIPGAPPHIIPWQGALLEYATTIDATTQPGYAGTPLIYLEDDREGGSAIRMRGDSCTIRGLRIEGTYTAGTSYLTMVRIEGSYGVVESCDLRVAPGGAGATLLITGAHSCVIGGSPETANRIETGHDGMGVLVSTSVSVRNSIRFNSIRTPLDGAGLAIDLTPEGTVNPNDTLDLDFGANHKQNFPVLTDYSSATSQVMGYVSSRVLSDYEVDLYANTLCDPSGHGDADLYIGTVSVTTDANGYAPFTATVASHQGRPYITATATDTLGSTSELSLCLYSGSATGIGDDTPSLPTQPALYQNTPNPFNPTTTIRYDIPVGGAIVDLAIYDVAGRRVKQLAAGFQQPGVKTAFWDGRSDRGRQVATGVYFYRLRAGAFVSTHKMVLLK